MVSQSWILIHLLTAIVSKIYWTIKEQLLQLQLCKYSVRPLFSSLLTLLAGIGLLQWRTHTSWHGWWSNRGSTPGWIRHKTPHSRETATQTDTDSKKYNNKDNSKLVRRGLPMKLQTSKNSKQTNSTNRERKPTVWLGKQDAERPDEKLNALHNHQNGFSILA